MRGVTRDGSDEKTSELAVDFSIKGIADEPTLDVALGESGTRTTLTVDEDEIIPLRIACDPR